MNSPLVKMVLLGALLGCSAATAAPPCTPVPEDRIGLQLYSLRSLVLPVPPASRAEKIDEVFAALSRIGFRRIERFSGTLGLPAEHYAEIAQQHGIELAASHETLSASRWEAALDQAKALGQTHVGSGNFGVPGLQTLEKTLKTAANLNRYGEAAAAKGLRFYVHNHEEEFKHSFPYDLDGSGKETPVSAWEIVAANTDPRYVHFEIDVHWARLGLGLDRFDALLDLLRRQRDRIELLHVKDTAADGSIADLGTGTTDWPALFEAAGPGVRYYLWEHDETGDPLKSAEIAYQYLRCKCSK